MKHIFEYDDSDIKGLMKDLKNIGMNDLQTVFIQTISKYEGSFDCWIAVGKSEEQIIEMLLDVDMVSPISIGQRVKKELVESKTVNGLLQKAYNNQYESDLVHFKVFYGLELQPSVKNPMLVCFQGFEFYKSINLLETYYTNIQEVLDQDLKKDWGNNLIVQKWGK